MCHKAFYFKLGLLQPGNQPSRQSKTLNEKTNIIRTKFVQICIFLALTTTKCEYEPRGGPYHGSDSWAETPDAMAQIRQE